MALLAPPAPIQIQLKSLEGFHRLTNALHCEGVSLAELADAEGTPLYVYSAGTIAARYRAIDDAFRGYPHSIHYALKANSTLAIARLLRSLGAAADANSGGEIDVALRAGFIPERIDRLARERGTRVRVALRVNPDIDARSHPHISTGLKVNKFGVAADAVREICRRFADRDGLELVGLHTHVGSQITDLEPLQRAATTLVALARELRDDGITIDHLDLGGGLGVSYDGSAVPSASDHAAAVLPIVRDSGLALILEPGRNIVGPAGVLLTRVVDVKDRPDGKAFVIVDAGMTELMRPMLYGAFHRIEPVVCTSSPDDIVADVVGPLCESSDTLGKDRHLKRPQPGDLFAVLDAGAYGAVMASNYNRRTMPAEVLVDGARWSEIRRRQTIDDLLALET
jgi:diaminopimelate decarboxylase